MAFTLNVTDVDLNVRHRFAVLSGNLLFGTARAGDQAHVIHNGAYYPVAIRGVAQSRDDSTGREKTYLTVDLSLAGLPVSGGDYVVAS